MNKQLNQLNKYFKSFINDAEIREELMFCLTQSQVELFVRSKFAFWACKNFVNTYSIIEKNRIDLLIQIEGQKYCIEFGHQINLLKHSLDMNEAKVKNDCKKLLSKLKNLTPKIGFNDLDSVSCFTISLFTDFHLVKKDTKYLVRYYLNENQIKSGVLAKYGNKISGKGMENYYKNYREELELSDYCHTDLIENQLSFLWKVKECQFTE